MDDCDSFYTHVVFRLFDLWPLTFIDRRNHAMHVRRGGVEHTVWVPIISVNNKSNIALATSCILYILIEVPSDWSLRYIVGGSTSYRRSVNFCWD